MRLMHSGRASRLREKAVTALWRPLAWVDSGVSRLRRHARLIRRDLDVAVIQLDRGRYNALARLAHHALLEPKDEALTKGCEIVLNGEK